jgi:hypothetical protein
MVEAATRAAAPAKLAPAAARPTMVFHRGTTIVRAVPESKGWRVEGDDPVLVARIAAALRRPMRTRVSREAVDEVSGEYQIESWMVTMYPDDPRHPVRVAHGPHRVGLDDLKFDDIELDFGG